MIVIAFAVPILASAKFRTGVPPKVTLATSPDITPTNAAVPVVVAVVNPS